MRGYWRPGAILLLLAATVVAACGAGSPVTAPATGPDRAGSSAAADGPSDPVTTPGSIEPTGSVTPSASGAPGATSSGAGAPSGHVATIAALSTEADGPGNSVSDAIANPGRPQLVNGILLRDADGVVWLCETLLTSPRPHCGEPRLLAEGWPQDPVAFEAADVRSAAGVRWFEDARVFGTVQP